MLRPRRTSRATVANTTKAALFAGATKWVVASTVVAVVATGGAVAYRAAEPPPPVAPEAETVRAPEPPVPHEITPPPRPPPSAIVEAEPEPSAIAPPVVSFVRPARNAVIEPVPGATPSAAPSAASTLSDELAMLADANAAVRRRDADAANRALDRHDARFPRGALATEAESLRIETVALRDPARGRTLAASFLQRNPKSPVAPRMRKLAEAP